MIRTLCVFIFACIGSVGLGTGTAIAYNFLPYPTLAEADVTLVVSTIAPAEMRKLDDVLAETDYLVLPRDFDGLVGAYYDSEIDTVYVDSEVARAITTTAERIRVFGQDEPLPTVVRTELASVVGLLAHEAVHRLQDESGRLVLMLDSLHQTELSRATREYVWVVEIEAYARQEEVQSALGGFPSSGVWFTMDNSGNRWTRSQSTDLIMAAYGVEYELMVSGMLDEFLGWKHPGWKHPGWKHPGWAV